MTEPTGAVDKPEHASMPRTACKVRTSTSDRVDVLKCHCESLGRDYDEIEKTVAGFIHTGQPTSEVVRQLEPIATMGFSHAIFNVYDDDTGIPLETMGRKLIPALAEL